MAIRANNSKYDISRGLLCGVKDGGVVGAAVVLGLPFDVVFIMLRRIEKL
jgi:hypothetical protein